jgi:WD40 repeat protein
VNAVAVAPDGSWLATGGADKTVRVWNRATGKKRAVLKGHIGAVTTVAVAPDGSWLATGGADLTMRIWEHPTWKKQVARTACSGTVNAVAIVPDQSSLATGDSGWAPRIWGPRTKAIWGPRTKTWEWGLIFGYDPWANVMVIAPDGSWMTASKLRETTSIWDPVTGQERNSLTLYRAVRLTSADIWNAVTRQKAKTRAFIEVTDVIAAAIAPDGSWLATGSRDGTARIWDAVTLRERSVLTRHAGALNTVAIAPDGAWLAIGSGDGTVQIWETATWRLWTLMRVDGAISSCVWLGSAGLAVIGAAGLFVFDFPAGAAPSSARHSDS